MYYVPAWVLAICLPASALAAYLALRGAEVSRRTLYVLTVALSPVFLLGAAVIAVVVSTALSAAFEPPVDTPVTPARQETTAPGGETNPATIPEATLPLTTGPASPSASSSASPGASPSASPAASASPPAD